MKNMRLAVVLASMLWISNVFATIVSYDITVSSNSWSSSPPGALPYGVAAQPTFTGTLSLDNTLSGRAALVDFNMVTGSRTWTEAMVGPASVSFDSQGNLASSLFSFSAPGEGESVLFTTNTTSASSSFILRDPLGIPAPMMSCGNCVSFSPTTNTTTPLAPFPTQNLKVTGPLYPPSSLLNPEYALSFDGTAFIASFDLGFYGADPGAALINTWTMGIEDTWSNKYYIHHGDASYPLFMEANLSFNNPEADFQIEVRNELADMTGNWPELRVSGNRWFTHLGAYGPDFKVPYSTGSPHSNIID